MSYIKHPTSEIDIIKQVFKKVPSPNTPRSCGQHGKAEEPVATITFDGPSEGIPLLSTAIQGATNYTCKHNGDEITIATSLPEIAEALQELDPNILSKWLDFYTELPDNGHHPN